MADDWLDEGLVMIMRLTRRLAGSTRELWPRWCVYACFFLSGSTSLVFEVLWSRQFVTVFGNSSYAISIVLCAYMGGLGLGGLIGGRLADRITHRVIAYGITQAAVGLWALAVPLLLAQLRSLAPAWPALSTESLLVSTLARFGISFSILLVPCFLMGATLPLLLRAVTRSDESVGVRVGALYSWNTLGAAFGCLVAGAWMIDTLGLHRANLVAVGVTTVIAMGVMLLERPLAAAADRPPASDHPSRPSARKRVRPGSTTQDDVPEILLLSVGFLSGVASLACEVLWIRYLIFLNDGAYVFPTILAIFLLGLGLGGVVYDLWERRMHLSVPALAIIEMLLAVSVLVSFAASAWVFTGGPPPPVQLRGMAFIAVFLPAVLMGMAFPLLCGVYGRQLQRAGARVGALFAVNTAGTVLGSLLPIFVLVPSLGIQKSLLLVSSLYGLMGLALLTFGAPGRGKLLAAMLAVYAGTLLLFVTAVPANLCQRVFLAKDFNLAGHTEILFYRQGRTGTATVTRDVASNCRTIYVNGASEVPVSYGHMLCFKMLGCLGPLLHPNPESVLMICLGGGIAAGTSAQQPGVKSLTIVDLESSVVDAARLFADENHGVLDRTNVHVVVDDGRNHLLMTPRKWPVIISDSTHPKSGDSWVLYTQEFYRLVRDRLTDDGIFVEWVPRHGLRTEEYKIIARTFQSVFPHSSLWFSHGMDAQGGFISYSLLVATPQPLNIDVARLRERLNAEPARRDLEPYGLHTPAGLLDAFICAEDNLRRWVGEGPINTDDLPYTQYETRYSKGMLMSAVDFVEPMEDIWPYLARVDSDPAAGRLREEIALRARASRCGMLGRLPEAFSLLPQDARCRQNRRLYEEEGPRYVQFLLGTYRDNPQGLEFLATLRAAGPGGPWSARPIYERILQLDPDNVTALNMVGGMQLNAGDLKSAEDSLRRAARLAPDFDATHFNLGLLLEKTGRHAEAVQEWKLAAEAASSDGRPADQWGICLAREGRLSEAMLSFSRAVEFNPTLVSARVHLAKLLYQTGRGQEALPHLRYALNLDPQNREALGLLAAVERRNEARSAP